jgi:demethylspheroidene O-methyltransferase
MSLADRLINWRNHLIANAKFQTWAARHPLTRSLARRKARETFDLVAGFVYSQVLAASVECGLLHAAHGRALTDAEMTARCGLPDDGARRLIRAALALDLIRRQADGRLAIGEAGAALIGNPSVFAMIRHHRVFYSDLADPIGLLRSRDAPTGLSAFWTYDEAARSTEASAYSELMAETQALVAQNVLDAYDFGRHRTIMDVGGGLGAFLSAVGNRHATPKLVLVDLPPVTELARERLAEGPLAGRVGIEPRDMLRDPLPEGADLITLVRVVHDHDDGPVHALLTAVRRALLPGGKLLIAEPMAGIPGNDAMADAYFGLYLWAMQRGQPRRPDELMTLLRAAGFTQFRQLKTAQPLLVNAIVAS